MIPIEIEVQQVKSMLDSEKEFLFVDCRESVERDIATINGTVHIPIGETIERISEFDSFKEKSIVIHCHHGGRSRQVTEYLRAEGFDNVQNMTGGIDEWSQSVDDSIARY